MSPSLTNSNALYQLWCNSVAFRNTRVGLTCRNSATYTSHVIFSQLCAAILHSLQWFLATFGALIKIVSSHITYKQVVWIKAFWIVADMANTKLRFQFKTFVVMCRQTMHEYQLPIVSHLGVSPRIKASRPFPTPGYRVHMSLLKQALFDIVTKLVATLRATISWLLSSTRRVNLIGPAAVFALIFNLTLGCVFTLTVCIAVGVPVKSEAGSHSDEVATVRTRLEHASFSRDVTHSRYSLPNTVYNSTVSTVIVRDAEFGSPDAMHFEVSKETLERWHTEGRL